jgi:DNA-binding MarR family transcriptional regulator
MRPSDSTFQLLFRCARLVDERARARINAEAGRVAFKKSHANLLPYLDFHGVRITVLADKLGITKQAVSKVVGEMVDDGVVEVVADPDDARAKLVRFTAVGAAAIQHGLAVLAQLERELARLTGARAMKQLRAALVALDAALARA